ncbi:MAG: IS630 transposase-related protein, partial [Cyanobacteria bacterium J06642_2]
MSNAYSYDFRKKVIDAIELDGLKKCEAAQVFNISRNTINLWFQLKAATGDVRAQSYLPTFHSHCINDLDKFRAFAN